MKWSLHNPIGFTPLPVTIITSVVYTGLFVTLLVIHLVVPSAPQNATPVKGINISEAWSDLQVLTNGFHPYNSHRNDFVRDWLLRRIETILRENKASNATTSLNDYGVVGHERRSSIQYSERAVIFNDMTSNVTFESGKLSVYFEGTNIMVYVRGKEDDAGPWWTSQSKPDGPGGVLVNAHYDSVSTGYGATDDGTGVVTILQLIKFFTTPGNQPNKGVVALLNNGEEDFLNGANAFCAHPIARSQFLRTFLNLEGAGAGGRATLFRSTDTEVTKFYKGSKHPFGTVVSGDGFKGGFIRSQTDYIIFNGILGLRGLDVAFMEPRSRYHTDQDDTRRTSIDSLWHMLSAALSTMQGLTSDTSSTFEGGDPAKGKVLNGSGSDAVWFDLFGLAFAVFELHTLFALSVTLLVVGPITLIVISAILFKVDKLYLFSSSKHHHHAEGDDAVRLQGWRGFFRYPIIFAAASAGVVGLAFLLNKINPFIVASSPYSVWSMMLSAWLFIAWFLSRASDFVRPTAFHRAYSLLWMFAGGWIVLVLVTVSEERFHIAAGYFMVFYFAALFLTTVIALLELFGLSRKSRYAEEYENNLNGQEEFRSPRSGSISSARLLAPGREEQTQEMDAEDNEQEDEPVETTSLLRGRVASTFANYTSRSHVGKPPEAEEVLGEQKKGRVYGYEQPWSWSLPAWAWLLQFLLLAPVAVVFVGQIGLLFISATYQTLSDGSSPFTIYIVMSIVSILLLAPLGPYLHRYTFHVPTFLLCVFAGTLIYNLIAFPFSANNRHKLYFIQRVDLDTGINRASLSGIGRPFLDEVIHTLPSAAAQIPSCVGSERYPGLTECSWDGIPPRVVAATHPEVPPLYGYADWLTYSITRIGYEAHIHVKGTNTRNCKIQFNRPISDMRVDGAGDDGPFKRVGEDGSKEIRLWSRTWEKPWNVHVRWESNGENDAGGLDGRIICLWNDENKRTTVPALEEIRRFAPVWVAISKLSDGLVEGSKSFLI